MSFNSSDDDSQQRFALGFLIALIALLISVVVGTVVVKQVRGSAAPKAAATAVATNAPAAPAADAVATDGASVRVENGVVKFYFASAKADLAAGANEALADVVKGVAEGSQGQTVGRAITHILGGAAAINIDTTVDILVNTFAPGMGIGL